MTSNNFTSSLTSSSYRSEFSIPIKKDSRTYDQREADKVINLERTFSDSSSTTAPTITSGGTAANKRITAFQDSSNWDSEITRWLNEARSRFNDKSILRHGTSDIENFGFDDTWRQMQNEKKNFISSIKTSSRFMDENFTGDIMSKMEERMNRDFGDFNISSNFGSEFGANKPFSTSSSYVKSSVTQSTTGSDGKTQVKSFSNIKDSKTVDGVTTSQTTSTKDERTMPFASRQLMHLNQNISSDIGTIKGNYEIGEDGKLHYKATLNAKDFRPEDLNVTTINNKLTITAKKIIQEADGSTGSKEFTRSIELPRLIDHEFFRCTLTDDGVLIIDAPVNTPDYSSITFDTENNLAIKAKDKKEANYVLTGDSKPTVVHESNSTQRKLHLEVPIPVGFTAQDIYVTTHDEELTIIAKKADNSLPKFSRSFDLPMSVDPISISAQLFENTLVVEAPLNG